MPCPMNTIEEWIYDKESFLSFIRDVVPDDHFICLCKPINSHVQFSVVIESEEELEIDEETDNT